MRCPYCHWKIASEHGLERHIRSSNACKQAQEQCQAIDAGLDPHEETKEDDLDEEDNMNQEEEEPDSVQEETGTMFLDATYRSPPRKHQRREAEMNADLESDEDDLGDDPSQAAGPEDGAAFGEDDEDASIENMDWLPADPGLDCDGEDDSVQDDGYPEDLFDPYADSTTDEETESEDDEDAVAKEEDAVPEEDEVQVDDIPSNGCRVSGRQFKGYVRDAFQNFARLSPDEKTAIKIMHKLMKKKATLDTYEAVMEWHLKESGQLQHHQALGDSKHFISRKKLMTKLKKRYNMDHKYATPHKLILPHTNSKIVV